MCTLMVYDMLSSDILLFPYTVLIWRHRARPSQADHMKDHSNKILVEQILIILHIQLTLTMTMKISLFDINHLNTMIRKNKAEKNVVNDRRPYKTI